MTRQVVNIRTGKFWLRYWAYVMCLTLLMLTLTNPVMAEKSPAKQPDSINIQPEKKLKGTQKKEWRKTFTPSEKISADQAVAFPVDI